MSETPEQMAEEYFEGQANTDGFSVLAAFLAGYKAARAVVEAELKLVQARREEAPGLGTVCYSLNNILEKMR